MSKSINLTQGRVALVDDADYKWLNQWKWNLMKSKKWQYAVRGIGSRKTQIRIFMHRCIMGLEKGDGKQTDHIDHNGLNNQKSNLRICTNQQNQFNRNSQEGAFSSYVGVTYDKRRNKYVAQFWHKKKNVYLGSFKSEIEAAKVHDRAALKYRGEFAKLNLSSLSIPHNHPRSNEAEGRSSYGGRSFIIEGRR